MNPSHHTRHRRIVRSLLLTMMIALPATPAFTSIASAGHDSGPRRDRHSGRYDGPSCPAEQLEYERGYSEGARDAWRQGYADALAGRPACDRIDRDFCNCSIHFKKGYKHAYRDTYLRAYERGRYDRPRRARWSWCW